MRDPTEVCGAELEAFCAEHHARLVGLLVLRVGDRHVAEELAQDALVRLVERWDRVRHLDAPWPRLVKVTSSCSWIGSRRLRSPLRAGAGSSTGRVVVGGVATRRSVLPAPS